MCFCLLIKYQLIVLSRFPTRQLRSVLKRKHRLIRLIKFTSPQVSLLFTLMLSQSLYLSLYLKLCPKLDSSHYGFLEDEWFKGSLARIKTHLSNYEHKVLLSQSPSLSFDISSSQANLKFINNYRAEFSASKLFSSVPLNSDDLKQLYCMIK